MPASRGLYCRASFCCWSSGEQELSKWRELSALSPFPPSESGLSHRPRALCEAHCAISVQGAISLHFICSWRYSTAFQCWLRCRLYSPTISVHVIVTKQDYVILTFDESRRVIVDVCERDVDNGASCEASPGTTHVLGFNHHLVVLSLLPVHVRGPQGCPDDA